MGRVVKYVLVGGNPFTCYTGTTTFTGLRVVGRYDTKEDIKNAVRTHGEECNGLLLALDSDLNEVTL